MYQISPLTWYYNWVLINGSQFQTLNYLYTMCNWLYSRLYRFKIYTYQKNIMNYIMEKKRRSRKKPYEVITQHRTLHKKHIKNEMNHIEITFYEFNILIQSNACYIIIFRHDPFRNIENKLPGERFHVWHIRLSFDDGSIGTWYTMWWHSRWQKGMRCMHEAHVSQMCRWCIISVCKKRRFFQSRYVGCK